MNRLVIIKILYYLLAKKAKRKKSHAERFASLQRAYDPPEELRAVGPGSKYGFLHTVYLAIPAVANYTQYKLLLIIAGYIADCSCYLRNSISYMPYTCSVISLLSLAS